MVKVEKFPKWEDEAQGRCGKVEREDSFLWEVGVETLIAHPAKRVPFLFWGGVCVCVWSMWVW